MSPGIVRQLSDIVPIKFHRVDVHALLLHPESVESYSGSGRLREDGKRSREQQ